MSNVTLHLQDVMDELLNKKIQTGIFTEACSQLNAIYFPTAVIPCFKIAIYVNQHRIIIIII